MVGWKERKGEMFFSAFTRPLSGSFASSTDRSRWDCDHYSFKNQSCSSPYISMAYVLELISSWTRSHRLVGWSVIGLGDPGLVVLVGLSLGSGIDFVLTTSSLSCSSILHRNFRDGDYVDLSLDQFIRSIYSTRQMSEAGISLLRYFVDDDQSPSVYNRSFMRYL